MHEHNGNGRNADAPAWALPPQIAADCPWALIHFDRPDGVVPIAELSLHPLLLIPHVARVAQVAHSLGQFWYRQDQAQRHEMWRSSGHVWEATMRQLGRATGDIPVPLKPGQPWLLIGFVHPTSCVAVATWSPHLLPEQTDLIAFALGEQARWAIVDHAIPTRPVVAGRIVTP